MSFNFHLDSVSIALIIFYALVIGFNIGYQIGYFRAHREIKELVAKQYDKKN